LIREVSIDEGENAGIRRVFPQEPDLTNEPLVRLLLHLGGVDEFQSYGRWRVGTGSSPHGRVATTATTTVEGPGPDMAL
jgi:hypothetical protein